MRGANESQKAAQRRRSGSDGVLAQGAQAIKDHTAKAEDEDKFSDFTRLNRWMDADPKHRTLVSLIRMGKSGVEDAAALGSSTGDNAVKAQKPYTDAELIAKGYSQWQIDEPSTTNCLLRKRPCGARRTHGRALAERWRRSVRSWAKISERRSGIHGARTPMNVRWTRALQEMNGQSS